MSYRAQAWAIDVEETLLGAKIDKAEKFVLMMLAYCHNEEAGCAWCTQRWLSRKTCMTERAIVNIVQRLKERGLIAIEQRATSSNLYTFPALETLQVPAAQPRQKSLPIAQQMGQQLELAKSGETKSEDLNAVQVEGERRSGIDLNAVQVEGERRSLNNVFINTLQKRGARSEREKRKADLEAVRELARRNRG